MLLTLLSLHSAHAATLAGVKLPDNVSVAGQSLVLNGMGLREKYMVDVYVGALYLPQKTTSAPDAINQDVPKRIVMHFTYDNVSKDKLVASFQEGLKKVPGGSAQQAKMDKLCSQLADVGDGDQVVLDYVPGKGTILLVNGAVKTTIAGADFMKAMWAIYLGNNPPTAKLKKGLLGL